MSDAGQYPSLVMIIRHGEKPGNPADDTNGGTHLSILGSARAAALPSLFTPDPTATPINKLAQLACDVKPHKIAEFGGNTNPAACRQVLRGSPCPSFCLRPRTRAPAIVRWKRSFHLAKPLTFLPRPRLTKTITTKWQRRY